jgi:hypothetical protein
VGLTIYVGSHGVIRKCSEEVSLELRSSGSVHSNDSKEARETSILDKGQNLRVGKFFKEWYTEARHSGTHL